MRKALREILAGATYDLCQEIDPDNDLRPLLVSRCVIRPDQLEAAYVSMS